MQSISRWALRSCAHPRAGRIASGVHRGLLQSRIPRFANIGVICNKNQVKLDRVTEGIMERSEMRKEINDVHDSKTMASDDLWPADGIWHASIIRKSSHRDGAIYKKNWGFWGKGRPINLSDCSQTVSELKKFSKDLPCHPDQENCTTHLPDEVIQIFSLRLAKTPMINSGSIQLYGYLAARDYMDGLFNYVFNRSRDNPVIVQQGSFTEMTGPRRSILMLSEILMEFDMRIKTGEKEEDDLQLIDGLISLDERMSMRPFTLRFSGSCGGAVDMCLALIQGMEAVIEVAISEVQSAFNLSLSSFVSVIEEEEHREIQLFHGAVGEFCTKRFVVAAPVDTTMHLRFRVGRKGSKGRSVYFCSFDVNRHGCVDRQIKLEAACVSVKMTVSPPMI